MTAATIVETSPTGGKNGYLYSFNALKAAANEEILLGKHCFPKCFLGAQTRKHLLRKQNLSDIFASAKNVFWGRKRGNRFPSATMLPSTFRGTQR